MDSTKKCNRCRRTLALSCYHADARKRDGLFTICKDCRAGRTSAPSIPDGYRMCRRCDQIKPVSAYYSAHPGSVRHTCIECCEARWKKSYRKKTHRIGNGPLTLFGYLSASQKRAYHRASKTGRQKSIAADRRYSQSPKGRAKRAAWWDANSELIAIYRNTRRAREMGLPAAYTADDWRLTLQAFDNQCAYCAAVGVPLTQDHWVPVMRGGAYVIGNIVPACKSCNSSKRDRAPEHFCTPIQYQRIIAILQQLSEVSNGSLLNS